MTGHVDPNDVTGGTLRSTDADATGGSDETASIREQIADTRARMSDTLEQLGERLNPHVVTRQLTEQVKDSVRDATLGRVKHMARNAVDKLEGVQRSVGHTVRENPIPLALIGVGVAWLVWNSRRGDGMQSRQYPSNLRLDDYETDVYDEVDQGFTERSATGGRMERAREQASHLRDTVRERVGQVGERAQHLAHNVSERTQELASRTTQQTRQMASRVADTTRRQAQRAEAQFQESPLAIGALTLAAGFAVGMSVRATDTEVRLMGDASERLADRARDMARETKDKVQNVAERVMDEGKRVARDAAREEGLPGA